MGPVGAQGKEFKIGLFIALSGPAALFGPTQRACADLAAEELNKAGGIMGRQVKLFPADAGGPPAETAKSAIRLMLEEKVDLFIGSHDSATRGAVLATIPSIIFFSIMQRKLVSGMLAAIGGVFSVGSVMVVDIAGTGDHCLDARGVALEVVDRAVELRQAHFEWIRHGYRSVLQGAG